MRSVGLLFVVALLLSGCGSSSSTDAQFVGRANAICADLEKRGKELARPNTPSDQIELTQRAGELLHRGERELAAVKPSADKRAAYKRFLTTVATEADAVSQLASELRTRNTTAARATLRKLSSNRVNREAEALGIAQCARTVEPEG